MFLDRAQPAYSPDELVQRAEQARRYLQDPFFQSIMEEAENDAITTWMLAATPDARERAWLLRGGLDCVVLTLQRVVGDAPLK